MPGRRPSQAASAVCPRRGHVTVGGLAASLPVPKLVAAESHGGPTEKPRSQADEDGHEGDRKLEPDRSGFKLEPVFYLGSWAKYLWRARRALT